MIPYLKLTEENIAKGYGKFPYMIVNEKDSKFLQLPIKIVTSFDNESETEIRLEKDGIINITVPLPYLSDDEKILDNCKAFLKAYSNHVKLNCCLVVGIEKAYYYDNSIIKVSDSIPEGGLLRGMNNNILGINTKHYFKY